MFHVIDPDDNDVMSRHNYLDDAFEGAIDRVTSAIGGMIAFDEMRVGERREIKVRIVRKSHDTWVIRDEHNYDVCIVRDVTVRTMADLYENAI